MSTTLEQILQYKIVAILRGIDSAVIAKTAEALYDGGVRVLEITLNSPDALSQIEILSALSGDKMLIGAGTVLNIEEARQAKNAGARFLISPGFDPDVVRFTKDSGLVSIPGAYTPTEVINAARAGADIVKVFPISNPDYLKSIFAPLDKIRMMPTGGVNAGNIQQFAKAGAVAFGIGSALVSKTDVADENYFNLLTEKAHALVHAVSSL